MGRDSIMAPPSVAPVISATVSSSSSRGLERDEQQQWGSFDNSVNAVSFGFVATAILISMFLVMAIFERFLRPPPSPSHRRNPPAGDAPSHFTPEAKLDYPSPQMTVYAKGVSVLMPGEEIPTFIAHPAPVPCPPERIQLPLCYHNMFPSASSSPTRRHRPI